MAISWAFMKWMGRRWKRRGINSFAPRLGCRSFRQIFGQLIRCKRLHIHRQQTEERHSEINGSIAPIHHHFFAGAAASRCFTIAHANSPPKKKALPEVTPGAALAKMRFWKYFAPTLTLVGLALLGAAAYGLLT